MLRYTLVIVVLLGSMLAGCGSEGEDSATEMADSVQADAGEVADTGVVSPEAASESSPLVGHWETVSGLEKGMVFRFGDDRLGSMHMGEFHDTFQYHFQPGESGQPGVLVMSNPVNESSQQMTVFFSGDTLTAVRQGDTTVMVRIEAVPEAVLADELATQLPGEWVLELEGTKLEHSFAKDGSFEVFNTSTEQRLTGSWEAAGADNLIMTVNRRVMKGRVSFRGDTTMILDTPARKLVFERME
jgi:hypothetical protein